MRLLLTGATGFLGRNLLLEVIKRGMYDEVLVPVRSFEKLRAQFLGDGFEAIPSKITPIQTSAPDWKLGSVGETDHVIHAAALLYASSDREYHSTNVEGTVNLLKGMDENSKVIILSSQAAGGPCEVGKERRSEEDAENPVTGYGRSKLEMERRVCTEFPNRPILFLRPPMVLGPRDSMQLPLFKMVRSRVRFKTGSKPKYFSFISVADLVDAIFAALATPIDWKDLPQKKYFVSASEIIRDIDLIEHSADLSGKKGITLPVPPLIIKGVSQVVDRVPRWREKVPTLSKDRVSELLEDRWVVSGEAFEKAFQWRAKESLRSTLSGAREWYLRTGQLER